MKITSYHRLIGTIIAFVLLLLSLWQYILLQRDVEQVESSISIIQNEYKDLEWSLINGVLLHSHLQAQINAKQTADKIVRDIQYTYPDLDGLKQQIDSNPENFDYLLSGILLENVKDRYMFNIRNERNSTFIMNNNGIIASYLLSQNYTSAKEPWNTNLIGVYNEKLCKNAIDRLLSEESGVVFWERQYSSPSNTNHEKIEFVSQNELKRIFYSEGIEGLRGYTILVPYYITQYGDLFGTADYSSETGERQQNYKMIVIQKFNLYDVLKQYHGNELNNLAKSEAETISTYHNIMRERIWGSIISIIVQVIVIILALALHHTIAQKHISE